MKLIIDVPDIDLTNVKNGSIMSANILRACKNGKPFENIHGKWETRYEIIRNPWGEEHNPQTKCSNCNFIVDTHSSEFMNFCPNCGADMRPEPYKAESEDE